MRSRTWAALTDAHGAGASNKERQVLGEGVARAPKMCAHLTGWSPTPAGTAPPSTLPGQVRRSLSGGDAGRPLIHRYAHSTRQIRVFRQDVVCDDPGHDAHPA